MSDKFPLLLYYNLTTSFVYQTVLNIVTMSILYNINSLSITSLIFNNYLIYNIIKTKHYTFFSITSYVQAK